MTSDNIGSHPFLRSRDGHHARVTYEELFFDLVYVFAFTKLSHGLLHHLTVFGALQTAVLWLAVWLGWQYTGWFTNWFNPELPAVRGVLLATMLLALLIGAAIPDAFAEHGLSFALCFVAMQVGRSAFVVAWLPPDHPLAPNYRRILAWMLVSALFWISGGLASNLVLRVGFWLVAALIEYVSPMIGFAFPGLGRSNARAEWTIEGAHLVERCQLFVLVALGETIMATGLPMAEARSWPPGLLVALIACFLTTISMWWLYFGMAGEDATRAITRSDNPGGMGALIHYLHVVLIAGIIVTAVGSDMLMENPSEGGDMGFILTATCGPALYLLGSILYKRLVSGITPLSHLLGVALLLLFIPLGFWGVRGTDALVVMAIMLGVVWGERRERQQVRLGV
ncbi:low temperature requirement protein A [Acetobacter sp.]|uniref:low temperature requirement protein A n=1 Tax=Acetobacter sp. TaxID=440 RepID=UPI0039EAAB28